MIRAICCRSIPVIIFTMLLILFTGGKILAQLIRPEIGRKFDYTFSNLINYPTKTAMASEFKGKLLILDFWSTGCKSCIESWPKLLKLQEKFKDEIQIVLVNATQDETVVKKIITAQKKIRDVEMTLPGVCKDTLLNRLFYYPGVPKIVWIDQWGYFRSFTSGSYLNEYIVNEILSKKEVTMSQLLTVPPGKSPYFYYERSKLQTYTKPFFVNGNGQESKYMPLVSQSVLTGKIDGLSQVLSTLATDSIRQVLTLHGSIRMMYETAYNNTNFQEDTKQTDLIRLIDNRIEWSIQEPKFLWSKASGEPNDDYHYCYQLTTTRPTKRVQIQKMLQFDLEKYFGLDAHLQKREKKCLVLTVADTALLKRQAGHQYAEYSRDKIRQFQVNNFYSIDNMLFSLSFGEYHKSPYPIIDETGYTGNVGRIKVDPDYRILNKELQKSGLELTLLEREIDILIVNEPEGYVFPSELEYESDVGTIRWKYDENPQNQR